jgi:PQQ-dependent catabolism-associated CXXCW motif protein
MSAWRAALAAAALFVMLGAASAAPPPEPEGFRTEAYKAPVPATLSGARVVSTDEAFDLWESGSAIFIDVLPRPPKPDLPEGMVWREKAHSDIPGSVWLPDVGYGNLTTEMEEWFRAHLVRLSGGDRARTMAIYCRTDCWMSWNAAKRAVGWGYTGIVWYPDGIDGWEAAGHPLEERPPEPRPSEQAVSR